MFLLKSKYPEYFSYKGRKISKKLSKSKSDLIRDVYHRYSFDEDIIQYHKKKIKKENIPKKKYKKVNIEIGFGNGEFLINNAVSNPKELFIGIEVYLNGIAKVLTTISEQKIENIILSNLNCFYFLEAMRHKSVDRIFIINPDPWIKKKHNKRRLISYETVMLLNKIIKLKNSIHITTDSETYLKHTKNLFNKHSDIIGDYNVSVLSKNEKLYGISRYQRKAIEEGRKIYLLTF